MALLVSSAAAYATDVPQFDTRELSADWQGYLAIQSHVAKDVGAMATELEALRIRVKQLEEENAGLKQNSTSAPKKD